MAIGDKLFVADKITLDLVKTNTDLLPSIKTKIDSSEYPNNTYYSSGSSKLIYTAGLAREIYSVTGEGEIEHAQFYQPNTNSMNGFIEFVVDDIVIFRAEYTSSVRRGICPWHSISYNSGVWVLSLSEDGSKTFNPLNVSGGGIVTKPYINNGSSATNLFMPYVNKIKFKNSFKVRLIPNASLSDSVGIFFVALINTK